MIELRRANSLMRLTVGCCWSGSAGHGEVETKANGDMTTFVEILFAVAGGISIMFENGGSEPTDTGW